MRGSFVYCSLVICLLSLLPLSLCSEEAIVDVSVGEEYAYPSLTEDMGKLIELNDSYVREDLFLEISFKEGSKIEGLKIVLTPLKEEAVPFSLGLLKSSDASYCDPGITMVVHPLETPPAFPTHLLLSGDRPYLDPQVERLIDELEVTPRFQVMKNRFRYLNLATYLFSEYLWMPLLILYGILRCYMHRRMISHRQRWVVQQYRALIEQWGALSLESPLPYFLSSLRKILSQAFNDASETLSLSQLQARLSKSLSQDESESLKGAFQSVEKAAYSTTRDATAEIAHATQLIHHVALLYLLQNQPAPEGLPEVAKR